MKNDENKKKNKWKNKWKKIIMRNKKDRKIKMKKIALSF